MLRASRTVAVSSGLLHCGEALRATAAVEATSTGQLANAGSSPARMHRRRCYLHATHLSTMSRTRTPPSALTPVAAQLRTVGVRRATPRRIHGVRLAIAATARSERRIAVRGPGVGVDTS